MGEAAEAGGGINPNVNVTSEGKSESKANSDVTWDDVAEVTQSRGGRRGKEQQAERKTAHKPKSSNAFDEATDDDAEDVKDGDSAKDKDGAADKERKAEKDAKDKADKEPPKKAKVHKFRSGDAEHDLSGDSTVTVVVDGKKEDVKLQDVLNNYSGKVAWDKRFTDLDKSEKAHKVSVGEMTKMVESLHEKAQKDPETAWDFLADWTKQDPVKLKEDILRKHIAEILPLAKLSPQQLETWIGDQKRNWRDRAHANRESAAKESEAGQRATAEKDEALKAYGIDDKSYDDAKDKLTRYLSSKDPQFDAKKLTTMNIIHAQRNLLALDVIQESVPHLANHAKFDSIVSDITSDLVRHPSITREKLATQLKDVFGNDNSRLKNLGRKSAKSDDVAEGDRRGASAPKSRSRNEAVTFDDLD